MDAVPGELVEASLIDGCSKVGTYLRIALPTSLPGLAVAAFYAFTVSWGDYLFVSVISGSDHTATVRAPPCQSTCIASAPRSS